MERIKGIDTLRFVCAFTVLIGHLEIPQLNNFYGAKYLMGILNNAFVGIAGVMIFFIISGFCIHFPYAKGKPIEIKSFYVQRLLRIGLPGLLAYVIYLFCFDKMLGVVWSLICEVIYYLLYPLIVYIQRKYKLVTIISFAFAVGILTSLISDFTFSEYNGNFQRNGFFITWLIGLPVWLLGVKIANDLNEINQLSISKIQIYGLRILVWATACICSIARFHLHISYPYSLMLFSLLGYYWIRKEVGYFKNRGEIELFGFGGRISYSIYLMHMTIPYLFDAYFPSFNYHDRFLEYTVVIILAFLSSILFYFLIEKPSHQIARNFKVLPATSKGVY